jgi:hypothetical protein
MRKISFYLFLIFLVASCDNKEEVSSKSQSLKNPTQTYIINGDIEYTSEITDGSKPKKPILVYDIPNYKDDANNNAISKSFEQSTTINFNYGIAGPTKSGCKFSKYNQSSGTHTDTDAGVYGYNPAPQENGYLVRGFSQPHHNYYYNALVLMVENRGYQFVDSRSGKIYNDNLSRGAAISIEYPFKANVTYEISLLTYFNDNQQLIYKINSNGFPTLHVQLKDNGILMDGEGACDTNRVYRIIESNPNYLKSYALENNIKMERTLIFKFSPTESKNALVLALHPVTGERGVDTKIPTNSYTMVLRHVTITEKQFDSSIIVPVPPGRR